MFSPVGKLPIIFTQDYKSEGHRGADLRSYDFEARRFLTIHATEAMTVTGRGIDGYGNDFMVCRLEDISCADTIKYIHCHFDPKIKIGHSLLEGQQIAHSTAIDTDYNPPRGNSTAETGGHHLHLEVWKDDRHLNPADYFEYGNLEFLTKKMRLEQGV
jgi:hypothetical protein